MLVARKSARRLMLFGHASLRGCWTMGLGFEPSGHKQFEGDGRTPEGWYRTSDKPWSDFAGAIAVHYPNERDAATALADRRIDAREHEVVVDSLTRDIVPPQQTALGGEILIHGGGSDRDWTLGCMALEDEDLAGLRAALPAHQGCGCWCCRSAGAAPTSPFVAYKAAVCFGADRAQCSGMLYLAGESDEQGTARLLQLRTPSRRP